MAIQASAANSTVSAKMHRIMVDLRLAQYHFQAPTQKQDLSRVYMSLLIDANYLD
jgi:hypothetical protein